MAPTPPTEMMLLKVPKWLSDIWAKAGPEAIVADLDLEGGKLNLKAGDGQERPLSLEVTRRTSPELFVFSQAANGLSVEGAVRNALHVKADMRDSAYKTMLERRYEDNAISSANRSVLDEERRDVTFQSERETIVGEPLRIHEAASLMTSEAPTRTEVEKVIQKELQIRDAGLTCEELLARLPVGCTLASVRDALVAAADCRESHCNGKRERRFFHRAAPAAVPVVQAALDMKRKPDVIEPGRPQPPGQGLLKRPRK
eukprot:gnl/TRDRNA2_/TRDRNA2_186856_c0_seq1.p1 gnl/TRDRNA2_/TRDRNA2_186856_c0~~gnl/TRDRNA2_/TRDRNA2_186856_c0_seq1.p1  ORF type:complete len:257 (+),score=59.13 gnl/TRDRNA2_/TRDRNA2_186856_c0_seq1:100-870(+)